MSKADIVINVDTRQVERAIKLTTQLLDLQKKLDGHPLRGRTLDKPKGRTL